MPPRPRAAAVAAVLAATVLSTAALAAPDARLLEAARGAEPAVIDTLRELVAIESGTMEASGLKTIADYAERRMKALGLQVERSTPPAGKGDVLVGRAAGPGRKRLMLQAHLDTIYWPGTLASQPYKLVGRKLYGPGIADDKGGVAVILHALALLRAQGWQDYAQLTVLFNADEESGSTGSGDTIAKLAEGHDVVLSYEPTASRDVVGSEGVLLAAAGTATATMKVSGRSSHAGAAPDLGRNAAVEMAHQILQTADVAKGIPGAQLNWTEAQSGKVRNQIPDQATASADVRLTQPDAAAKLQAALNARAAEHRVPDTMVEYTVNIGRPPFVGDARTLALAKKAQAIYAELDGRALQLVPGTGGGTDAGYAQRSGKPAVLESLGLAGWGYHAKDEYVDLDSIVPRLYLTMRLLTDLGRE